MSQELSSPRIRQMRGDIEHIFLHYLFCRCYVRTDEHYLNCCKSWNNVAENTSINLRKGRVGLEPLKDTLSKLDVNKIVKIPNLQHDINLDPGLHFQLNLEGEDVLVRSGRPRRGRGPRQVIGLDGSDDPNNPDFFVRDFDFRSNEGSPNLARCRLDSQCEVPLVSQHWLRENKKLPELSKDFKDLGAMSVSGHDIQVDDILRNMVFNLRGSTVTYRRDIFVYSQLDGWGDMVAGAKFIAKEFVVLFSKAKISFRKETREEKIQKQKLQDQSDVEYEESERLRRQRKAKEEIDKARRRKREADLQMAQNGHAAGRL